MSNHDGEGEGSILRMLPTILNRNESAALSLLLSSRPDFSSPEDEVIRQLYILSQQGNQSFLDTHNISVPPQRFHLGEQAFAQSLITPQKLISDSMFSAFLNLTDLLNIFRENGEKALYKKLELDSQRRQNIGNIIVAFLRNSKKESTQLLRQYLSPIAKRIATQEYRKFEKNIPALSIHFSSNDIQIHLKNFSHVLEHSLKGFMLNRHSTINRPSTIKNFARIKFKTEFNDYLKDHIRDSKKLNSAYDVLLNRLSEKLLNSTLIWRGINSPVEISIFKQLLGFFKEIYDTDIKNCKGNDGNSKFRLITLDLNTEKDRECLTPKHFELLSKLDHKLNKLVQELDSERESNYINNSNRVLYLGNMNYGKAYFILRDLAFWSRSYISNQYKKEDYYYDTNHDQITEDMGDERSKKIIPLNSDSQEEIGMGEELINVVYSTYREEFNKLPDRDDRKVSALLYHVLKFNQAMISKLFALRDQNHVSQKIKSLRKGKIIRRVVDQLIRSSRDLVDDPNQLDHEIDNIRKAVEYMIKESVLPVLCLEQMDSIFCAIDDRFDNGFKPDIVIEENSNEDRFIQYLYDGITHWMEQAIGPNFIDKIDEHEQTIYDRSIHRQIQEWIYRKNNP